MFVFTHRHITRLGTRSNTDLVIDTTAGPVPVPMLRWQKIDIAPSAGDLGIIRSSSCGCISRVEVAHIFVMFTLHTVPVTFLLHVLTLVVV